jgi:hypothetical protein
MGLSVLLLDGESLQSEWMGAASGGAGEYREAPDGQAESEKAS